MRQRRGRRSAASLTVVPIDAIQRPKPPESMSEAGKKLWRDTVKALRADWFQGAEPVLQIYVETIELSRWLWEMRGPISVPSSLGSPTFTFRVASTRSSANRS